MAMEVPKENAIRGSSNIPFRASHGVSSRAIDSYHPGPGVDPCGHLPFIPGDGALPFSDAGQTEHWSLRKAAGLFGFRAGRANQPTACVPMSIGRAFERLCQSGQLIYYSSEPHIRCSRGVRVGGDAWGCRCGLIMVA